MERKEELDEEGNPKTTYTLKKEETSTDENGNTVTRVTYYKITGNTVETTTETTLKLKVEKGTETKKDQDLSTEAELPDSITVKNGKSEPKFLRISLRRPSITAALIRILIKTSPIRLRKKRKVPPSSATSSWQASGRWLHL